MASGVPQAAITEIQETVGVMESAKVLIDGFSARMQAAVDAALANGATEAELAPVAAEIANLDASSQALAAAVAANSAVKR